MNMNKKQAICEFKALIMPYIKGTDYPMRREEWSCYTDMLHRDGRITDRQYNNWTQPDFCNAKVRTDEKANQKTKASEG